MRSTFLPIAAVAARALAQDSSGALETTVVTNTYVSSAAEATGALETTVVTDTYVSSAAEATASAASSPGSLVTTLTGDYSIIYTTDAIDVSTLPTVTGGATTTTGAIETTGAFVGPTATASFLDVVTSDDSVSTLVNVLQEDRFSSLFQRLTVQGATFSALAPTNEAFEAFLATENGQRFQNDDEYATQLLEYHILLGVIGFNGDGSFGDGFLGSDWYRTFLYAPDAQPRVDSYVGLFSTEDGGIKVVSGYMNEATVQQANIQFDQGYIHTIDQVLTIPPTVQNLLVNGGFTSLLGAIQLSGQAGLGLSAIQDIPNPTIFAPTNEAFQNIGSVLGGLSAQDVANVLKYHIAPQIVLFASDLSDGQQLTTITGDEVIVTIQDGDSGPMIFINGAQVVQPNLAASEGVVHGIDQVLNANNITRPNEGATSGSVMYQGAMSVDNPPLTSGQPTPTTSFAMPAATDSSSGGSSSAVPEQQAGNGAGHMAKIPGVLGLGAVVAAAML